MRTLRPAVVCIALLALVPPLLAQGPSGANTLSARAVADSQSALRTLDGYVRANPKDAAAWHRRGMVAWALADRARAANPPRVLDATLLGRLADSSLRIAAELEPKNSRYRFMVARYLLQSGVSITRAASYGHFDKALELARTSGNPEEHADAAVEVGRVYWRRYDAQANRWIVPADTNMPFKSIEQAIQRNPLTMMGGPPVDILPEIAINLIHQWLIAMHGMPGDFGDADYIRAERLFREARNIDPRHKRAFHQLAMLLAERKRWTELRATAAHYVAVAPNDHWGWQVLGLAQHRAKDLTLARASFDSALARASERDRSRIAGLRRLLRPSDTLAYLRADSAARAAQERLFWLLADPLWARAGNDVYAEFLARVTFADLRWTVDELGVRGADSDRGDIHIRHGPPDIIATFISDEVDSGVPSRVTFWDYDTGLLIVFWGQPTFATAHYPVDDRAHVEALLDLSAASWDNVQAERILDMPVQAARFRASGDSVDLYLATRGPVAEIREASVSNAPVRLDAWLFGRDVPEAYRDSSDLRGSGVQARSYRLRPSTYMYRLEVTSPDVLVAGRAMSWIVAGPDSTTGFALHGFGLSDLVVAESVAPRGASVVSWRDFAIAPLLGPVRRGGTLDLLWENYELGAREGRARYTIEVSVEPDRGTVARVAARIASGVAGVVGVDRRENRITLRFDREAPHAQSVVERITLSLDDTPPGNYKLTLRMADQATGRAAVRVGTFMIRE